MSAQFKQLAKNLAVGCGILMSIATTGCFFPGAVGKVHPKFETNASGAQYSHVGRNLIEDGHQLCIPETDASNAVSFDVSGIQIAVNTGDRNRNACQSTALIVPIPYEFRFAPAALKDQDVSIWVEISGADAPLNISAISIIADNGQSFRPYDGDQCKSAGCTTTVRFDAPCSIIEGGNVVIGGLKKNGVPVEVPPVRITWGADRGWLMCVID